MEYIAHKKENGEVQLLKEHLKEVSELAGRFAESFDASEHAKMAGLLHDAGKYSEKGQQRMRNPEHAEKVDHSTAGAQISLQKLHDPILGACVAGHHSGLMNIGGKFSSEGDGTLFGRCKKELKGQMGYDNFFREFSISVLNQACPAWLKKTEKPFAIQFYTRMLFSCLVDADYLNTEAFFSSENMEARVLDYKMEELAQRVKDYVQPWLDNPNTELNFQRCRILQSCLRASDQPKGLFTLTVPTGGGKTVSSLAFAVMHARRNKQKRIIYVIPYTSIIEQNAEVFRQIVGDEFVLEHHSNVDYSSGDDLENEGIRRKILSTENWDSPIIITTAVQFFESLFAKKSSRCRKLHNIANSVIIFDEAQMIPLDYLRPCVSVIAELVSNYNVSAVLCTATQPSLNCFFNEYVCGLKSKEICTEVEEIRPFFKRVRYKTESYPDLEDLVLGLSSQNQALCIVNRRKTAQEIYEKLPGDSRYHLSTLMTAEHRSMILEEIKIRLKKGEPCHLVSTSLIEAGVDIDFPQVWREIAGLDSIIQSAGRCNREGKRPYSESWLHLFSLGNRPPRNMEMNVKAAEMVLESTTELDSPNAIKMYYDNLLWMLQDGVDKTGIMNLCAKMEFKTISDLFHIIDSNTKTVYIPTENNQEEIRKVELGLINRQIIRKMSKSSVNIYQWEWENLIKGGKIKEVMEDAAILLDKNIYSASCGLDLRSTGGDAIWI